MKDPPGIFERVRRFQSSERINPNSHPKEREWDNPENISRISVLNNSQRIFTKVILSRIEETPKLIICGLVQFQHEMVFMYQIFPISQNGEIEGFCVTFFAEGSLPEETIKICNNGKNYETRENRFDYVLLHHLHMY